MVTDDVTKMKMYTGDNSGAGSQKVMVKEILKGADEVKTKSYALPLRPSYKLYPHSPDGFQWGYCGSGPAQLALAILLDLTRDPDLSVRLHQEFKRNLIATSGDHLVITEPDIRKWLKVTS